MKQVTVNLLAQNGCTYDHSKHSSTIQADKIISLDNEEGKPSNMLQDKTEKVMFLVYYVYSLSNKAIQITQDINNNNLGC
jgi:radical SAM superfamily enzyme